MSRKGHYNGGSTIIRPWNSSWFGKKSPKWAKRKKSDSAPKRPLSPVEQASLAAFTESRGTGTRLIPKGQEKKKRSLRQKFKGSAKKPPGIKPEPSRPQKNVTVVHQTVRRGKSRMVSVEFSSDKRTQR
ncbi:MAG: hypothetical protein J0I08_24255 [Rhizobiales bacterium]|nr:hypothetical protein [Hyphomicrobiales bacterium]